VRRSTHSIVLNAGAALQFPRGLYVERDDRVDQSVFGRIATVEQAKSPAAIAASHLCGQLDAKRPLLPGDGDASAWRPSRVRSVTEGMS
jgi:hypothetical protein